jgi:hypothetical protein
MPPWLGPLCSVLRAQMAPQYNHLRECVAISARGTGAASARAPTRPRRWHSAATAGRAPTTPPLVAHRGGRGAAGAQATGWFTRRPRSARAPDPVWGPLLEGLLLLEQQQPERFMQACRRVAFYLTGLDTRLQRQLLELKPDPAMAAGRR